ncbi:hypothetical protein Bca52824_085274 [Brassica carinata]|uniref:Uncharacterized protein n=1 Tax=Brassica carinata TaxID=52824 RepID=A0A8X7TMM8_BRACI|nr:hypothetical protein Bca52824_085274 [Brassica carinata]
MYLQGSSKIGIGVRNDVENSKFSIENIVDLFPIALYGEEGPTGQRRRITGKEMSCVERKNACFSER